MDFVIFFPFVLLLFFVFSLRDLFKSLLLVYLITLLISFFLQIHVEKIIIAHLESVFVGFRIFLLVFSLLLLFKIIEKENIKFFKSFKEKNFTTFITIGVFLTILIEGLVGFGTPGMIAVRTLYDLGFNPLISASISLLSDQYSTFGAFSTPIIIGSKDAISFNFVKLAGIVLSFFIFFVLISAHTLYSKFEKKEKLNIEIIITFLIYFIVAFVVSQTQFFTFTIVFASLASILFILLREFSKFKKFLQAFSPFFITIIIFIILKILNIQIINKILEIFNISLIALIISIILIFKDKKYEIKQHVLDIFKKSLKLFFIIFFLSFLASFLMSSSNIVYAISRIFETKFHNFKELYFFISPLIGIFGAFVFGSATLSNLTFVKLQQEIATTLNLNVDKILALQNIGAGIGNMISLYNISAIAIMIEELKGNETKILKINLIFSLILSFISSLIVLLL